MILSAPPPPSPLCGSGISLLVVAVILILAAIVAAAAAAAVACSGWSARLIFYIFFLSLKIRVIAAIRTARLPQILDTHADVSRKERETPQRANHLRAKGSKLSSEGTSGLSLLLVRRWLVLSWQTASVPDIQNGYWSLGSVMITHAAAAWPYRGFLLSFFFSFFFYTAMILQEGHGDWMLVCPLSHLLV